MKALNYLLVMILLNVLVAISCHSSTSIVRKILLIHPLDYIIPSKGGNLMDDVEELRKKYMKNPPEGYTAKDIEEMTDEDILDMDYFLNE